MLKCRNHLLVWNRISLFWSSPIRLVWLVSDSQWSYVFASQMLTLRVLVAVPLSFRNVYVLRGEQYTHGNCLPGTWKSGDNLECEPLRASHFFFEIGSLILIDRLSNSEGPSCLHPSALRLQIHATLLFRVWVGVCISAGAYLYIEAVSPQERSTFCLRWGPWMTWILSCRPGYLVQELGIWLSASHLTTAGIWITGMITALLMCVLGIELR